MGMNVQRGSKQKLKSAVDNFWMSIFHSADTKPLNHKNLQLPLARIKRLMKIEEEVKMVASEVPILFSKITEVFIEELTLRAWINTRKIKDEFYKNLICLSQLKHPTFLIF